MVRTVKLSWLRDENGRISLIDDHVSNVVKAPDWILDLAPLTNDHAHSLRCAAVTAHNALLEVNIRHVHIEEKDAETPLVSVRELTSSSRSILYSAHLLWESGSRILVAAGTAFGEIIYWSWDDSRPEESRSRIHRVFLGHEGSIFGVQISGMLSLVDQEPKRLLASCSDDRTIRIWDVSKIAAEQGPASLDGDLELQRTRHTGFTNSSFDTDVTNNDCLAIGWGHTSRVWKVEFLEIGLATEKILLQSAGEDATSRTWRLTISTTVKADQPNIPSWKLELVDTAAHHNGKNVWSMSVLESPDHGQHVTLGGADSKITKFRLSESTASEKSSPSINQSSYDIEFFMAPSLPTKGNTTDENRPSHRSSKQTEFLRSYAFLDESSFILTTNSGSVYLETLSSAYSAKIAESKFLAVLNDLSGYSVCAGELSLGVAFVAGAKGSLYAYTKHTSRLTKLHTVNGKIGEIFAVSRADSPQSRQMLLLVTVVGQRVAQLLDVDLSSNDGPTISRTTDVPIPDYVTGLAITSMVHIDNLNGEHVILGFRRGAIAAFHISDQHDTPSDTGSAKLLQIINSVHGKETVTAMIWVANSAKSTRGHLVSIGRDGCVAIRSMDLANNSVGLVHNLTLPIGPNLEGLYIHNGELYVYGFSSKRFVVYNTITEEEIMSIETGGAHRSWTFQPNTSCGGTLVWTRASSMHVHTQPGLNHKVIRSGGHGREMKAVAVSPRTDITNDHELCHRQLIATGAEDTDIKIFSYFDQHLACHRTLRKHTTGIQCLQWSADGLYLFSSGGCEEFYVWKISHLPLELGGVGVVCEASCTPESEHSDLRIMAFDVVQQSQSAFVISMAFSNSVVKVRISPLCQPSMKDLNVLTSRQVYIYDSCQLITKWQKLAAGLYFTSCLTQCVLFRSEKQSMPHAILTAGTDGHAVLWPILGSSETKTITYHSPTAIHQSSSKALVTYTPPDDEGNNLIVSGGDDGSIAFLIASSTPGSEGAEWVHRPVIVVRTHASAVTACAILKREHDDRLFTVTSGNDQWVRVWELILSKREKDEEDKDWMEVKRVGRVKTSVADVSSMAVLASDDGHKAAKVLICGVGMEVIRIEWDAL